MYGAAKAGAAYIPKYLDEDPAVQVDPRGWVQSANDGRPLDSLLYSAVTHTKMLLGSGQSAADALGAGGAWLDMLAHTQVADAARGAAGVAITSTPRMGYSRLVSPPCCQRCAVLAGKFFKWNAGFQRHPRCDCRHVPVKEGSPLRDVDQHIGPDQIKDLTKAQRSAIADGADQNQVINAHRAGSRSSDGMTTVEGTTRRGYASYVNREVARQKGEVSKETVVRSRGRRNVTRTKPRLTPEAIYRLSSTREEAVRLLGLNGYLLGDIAKVAARVA